MCGCGDAGRRDLGTGSASPTAWQTRQGRREVRLSYATAAVWGHGFGWGGGQKTQGSIWRVWCGRGMFSALCSVLACSPILSSFYRFRLAMQRTAGRHAESTLMDPRTLLLLPATVTFLAVSN